MNAGTEMKAMVVRSTAELPLLSRLSPADVDGLAGRSRKSCFVSGATIFAAGDVGDSVYVVVQGQVRLVAHNPSGKEATVRVVNVGDSFGELAVLTRGVQSLTAVACQPTKTAVMARASFVGRLNERPEAALALLEILSLRLDRLSGTVGDMLVLDLSHRIAKQLVRLGQAHRGGAARVQVRLALTQVDLGAHLGASRESVNKHLREFVERGWLSTARGEIVITNEAALRAYAESEAPA
ncbi:MAG: Crp/Fnr family transcriptional regulator [Vicinamibacterales bacterium]